MERLALTEVAGESGVGLREVVGLIERMPAGSERRARVFGALEFELMGLLPVAVDGLREMLGAEDSYTRLTATKTLSALMRWLMRERETEAKLKILAGGITETFSVNVTVTNQTRRGVEEARREALEGGRKTVRTLDVDMSR
mgnify:CR=1 FL=1